MTTNELVNAILTIDAFPSPSPSLLALLAENARRDQHLWQDVISPPFAERAVGLKLGAVRRDWNRHVADLRPFAGTISGTPPESGEPEISQTR
jgi:hypothetical protein